MMTSEAKPETSRPTQTAAGTLIPHVAVGDTVYWYPELPGGTAIDPYPGIVSRVCLGGQVALNLIQPDLHNFILKDGVKWHGDPTLRPDEVLTNGCWSHRPKAK